MIKGIIFDKDGTLFDSEKVNINAWCEALKEAGASDDPSIIKSVVGLDNRIADQILVEHYGKYGIEEIRKNKNEKVRKVFEKEIPLKEGALSILEYAYGKYKLALATSTLARKAIPNLKKAKLHDYFDTITTGDMVEKGKPNPEIFLTTAFKLGLKPEEIIVIEDSKHGIKAARLGGFIPVLIPDQISPDEEMLNYAEYVFDNLLDVKAHLEKCDII